MSGELLLGEGIHVNAEPNDVCLSFELREQHVGVFSSGCLGSVDELGEITKSHVEPRGSVVGEAEREDLRKISHSHSMAEHSDSEGPKEGTMTILIPGKRPTKQCNHQQPTRNRHGWHYPCTRRAEHGGRHAFIHWGLSGILRAVWDR